MLRAKVEQLFSGEKYSAIKIRMGFPLVCSTFRKRVVISHLRDGSGDLCRNSLESTYHHYRQLFEDRSRLTWQEEGKIQHPKLREYIALLHTEFWKNVDSMTRMYFKMIDLHKKRIMVENKINEIWKEYVSPPKEINHSSSSEFSSRYSDTTSCSEKAQRKNSQSVVNKWYKTRVVRYKIASEFAAELRLAILIAIQNSTTAHSVLALSPTFSMLEDKKHWFRSQARTLENNIKQLTMSRHIVRAELNSDRYSTDHCIKLTEKKMKPNMKRLKVIKTIS